MKKLREEMKRDAQSVNKYLTDEKLDSMTDDELVANVHPLYRQRYIDRLTFTGWE